jgi:glycosyltransferase involved in cell wall biosynthesis
MKKPKIIILSPPLTAVSGFSTHVNLLIKSRLVQKYDFLHFYAGSEGRNESRLQRILRLLASPFSLLWMNITQRPDIVHINTGLDQKSYWRDLVYLGVSKLAGSKVINQIHGGPMPEQFFPHSALLTALLRRTLNASDAVVILSVNEYKAYTAFVPGALVAHIPNAIALPEALKEMEPSDPQQPLRLIYIGRLVREKGLFEVIDAVGQLRQSGRRVHLDIAGSGVAERELRARASVLGLDEIICFHGPVFGAEKNNLWDKANLLVFPTYNIEGLPYSLLEAMAAGTPAIICSVGAIPDVMQDGVHGLFVPPHDVPALVKAILTLDDDRVLLDQMARASRARVLEQYSITRLEKDFGALYEAVLTDSR